MTRRAKALPLDRQPTFRLAAAIGSEKPKNGRARLTNPFLYCSMSVLPSMIYVHVLVASASSHSQPATICLTL